MSSASTIAATSLAASVPRRPMATPTSARFSAGASLTPSPVMATTAPSACSASTSRSLCSGLVRAKTVASRATRRRPPWSRPSSSRPVTAFGSWARPSWRAMASAVATWSPVIILIPIPAARQSRTAAIASVRGGSISPSSPRKTRPPSISAMARRAGSPGMAARRDGEHALAARGKALDRVVPEGGIEGDVAGGRALHPTHVEQALGCTLDVDQCLAADRSVQRRHVAVPGIERDLVDPRELRPSRLRFVARLGAEHDERTFHRVALDHPVRPVATQLRIVAEQCRQGDLAQDRVTGRLDGTLRRVADAMDGELPVGRDHRLHGHLVAGQRAGLVRADGGDRAQGLDRGQPADDGMPGCHAPDADGERDGHHGGQAFRDHRYREPDHGHEGIGDRVAAQHHGEEKDGGRARERDQGDLTREAVHLADQRRAHRLHRAQQRADPAEFGGRAGSDGDTGAAAAGNERAGERQRGAIAQRRIRGYGRDALLGGHRFAGQRRLVQRQAARPDQAQIGRDSVAGLEQDDIARHDVRPPATSCAGRRGSPRRSGRSWCGWRRAHPPPGLPG